MYDSSGVMVVMVVMANVLCYRPGLAPARRGCTAE